MKEKKKKIKKNKRLGRKRSIFPTRFLVYGLFITLQIILTLMLAFALGDSFIYAQALQSVFSIVITLHVLNRDEPAAHKLPWAVLVIMFPLAGPVLYLMFGTPQQTRKAKKRFETVNKETSLFLKPDEKTVDELENCSPEAKSLSAYLEKTCK